MFASLFLWAIPRVQALNLIQPVDKATYGEVDSVAGGGVQIIMNYLGKVWPWFIAVGVGIGLLRIVIAGIQIMHSGGNPALRGSARESIMWAVVGLLLLVFAGALLSTVNPDGFGVV